MMLLMSPRHLFGFLLLAACLKCLPCDCAYATANILQWAWKWAWAWLTPTKCTIMRQQQSKIKLHQQRPHICCHHLTWGRGRPLSLSAKWRILVNPSKSFDHTKTKTRFQVRRDNSQVTQQRWQHIKRVASRPHFHLHSLCFTAARLSGSGVIKREMCTKKEQSEKN